MSGSLSAPSCCGSLCQSSLEQENSSSRWLVPAAATLISKVPCRPAAGWLNLHTCILWCLQAVCLLCLHLFVCVCSTSPSKSTCVPMEVGCLNGQRQRKGGQGSRECHLLGSLCGSHMPQLGKTMAPPYIFLKRSSQTSLGSI